MALQSTASVPRPPKPEICANCGRQIGRLETPSVWREGIVCGGCYAILSGTASSPLVGVVDPWEGLAAAKTEPAEDAVHRQHASRGGYGVVISAISAAVAIVIAVGAGVLLHYERLEHTKQSDDLKAKIDAISAKFEKADRERTAALNAATGKPALQDTPSNSIPRQETANETPAPQSADLDSIPLVGDETPIGVIMADPKKYVGKGLVVCGGVMVADSYSGWFDGMQDEWYSFYFQEFDAAAHSGRIMWVYMTRKIDGSPLVDAAAKTQGGGRSKLVRLKVVVTPKCFRGGKWDETFEINDYQFINSDRKHWGKWASENKPTH